MISTSAILMPFQSIYLGIFYDYFKRHFQKIRQKSAL